MGAGVTELFDAMADSYDRLEPWYEHLYAAVHAILRAELGPPRGQCRALDAGCGTGLQSELLRELGYETHGIDLSSRLLAVAKARRGRCRFARGTIEALPYRTGGFDAVACCGSTLSFLDAPARALREVGRVLRPGGLLLLECEHKWSVDLGWALLSSLTRDSLGYGVSARELWRQLARPLRQGFHLEYPGYGRLRLFTATELDAMLAEAHLIVLRAWGIHSVTNLIPSTILHRDRLARPLAVLFRALCMVDGSVSRFRGARGLANSLVVLARKESRPRERLGDERQARGVVGGGMRRPYRPSPAPPSEDASGSDSTSVSRIQSSGASAGGRAPRGAATVRLLLGENHSHVSGAAAKS